MGGKVLVVGATGMLGEPVARALKESEYDVRILARSPEKAKAKFGESFEIAEGDVEKPETLKPALEGCCGVHINLSGGPKREDYDRIEHRGAANVAKVASETGIERITYISGASAFEENAWFYMTKAKVDAEKAIKESGVPYSIFCPTWFMESLALFVRGNKAAMIGKNHHPYRLVAAKDYAHMVVKAYGMPEAANKRFFVYGPGPLDIVEAFRRYCAIIHPDLKVSVFPTWILSFIGAISGNPQLKDIVAFIKYCEKQRSKMEGGDPT